MPDLTPNNPGSNPPNSSGDNNERNFKYELITSYIDNEIKDEIEKESIKKLIETDIDFHNRFVFEKLTKKTFKEKSHRIETPVYLYKKIGAGIDDYIKAATLPKTISSQVINQDVVNQEYIQKSNLKRNLIFASVAFVFLVAAAFLFNGLLKRNPQLRENDIVAVSRNVYDEVTRGQVDLKYKTSSPKELSDTMNKYVDFKVYVPEMKDAILVGGVCNEINGQKLAHFVFKKGNYFIYTLEANKDIVLNEIGKILLCEESKKKIAEGKNYFPCTMDGGKNTIVWFKEGVICSSVSDMESNELAQSLSTNK